MSLRVVIAGNTVSCLGITPLLADKASVFLPACSLGVVLSRGHGEYILLGNTSVEEGRLIWDNHAVLRDKVATLNFTASLLLHSPYLPVCYLTECSTVLSGFRFARPAPARLVFSE